MDFQEVAWFEGRATKSATRYFENESPILKQTWQDYISPLLVH